MQGFAKINKRRPSGNGISAWAAELLALQQAAKALGGWWLLNVTLCCTLEPCSICAGAGAMVQARLPHLVYGTHDPKTGAAGSVMNLLDHEQLNHRVEATAGVLADEARAQLQIFFARLRTSS